MKKRAWEGQAGVQGWEAQAAPLIHLLSLSQPLIFALPYIHLLHLFPVSCPSSSHILADGLASKFSGNSLCPLQHTVFSPQTLISVGQTNILTWTCLYSDSRVGLLQLHQFLLDLPTSVQVDVSSLMLHSGPPSPDHINQLYLSLLFCYRAP